MRQIAESLRNRYVFWIVLNALSWFIIIFILRNYQDTFYLSIGGFKIISEKRSIGDNNNNTENTVNGNKNPKKKQEDETSTEQEETKLDDKKPTEEEGMEPVDPTLSKEEEMEPVDEKSTEEEETKPIEKTPPEQDEMSEEDCAEIIIENGCKFTPLTGETYHKIKEKCAYIIQCLANQSNEVNTNENNNNNNSNNNNTPNSVFGLNTGSIINTCYINTALQSILACNDFCDFITKVNCSTDKTYTSELKKFLSHIDENKKKFTRDEHSINYYNIVNQWIEKANPKANTNNQVYTRKWLRFEEKNKEGDFRDILTEFLVKIQKENKDNSELSKLMQYMRYSTTIQYENEITKSECKICDKVDTKYYSTIKEAHSNQYRIKISNGTVVNKIFLLIATKTDHYQSKYLFLENISRNHSQRDLECKKYDAYVNRVLEIGRSIYILKMFVYYSGSGNSGHYCLYKFDNNKWWCISDNSYRSVDVDECMNIAKYSGVYYLYEKVFTVDFTLPKK